MLRYEEGFKYQLVETYTHNTKILGFYIASEFVELTQDGVLVIREGYAWDGPSGPTYDSKSSMRASLVHDALYQLMHINPELLAYRDRADQLLYDICVDAGMGKWRAYLWKKAVNWFGKRAAEEDEIILEAP